MGEVTNPQASKKLFGWTNLYTFFSITFIPKATAVIFIYIHLTVMARSPFNQSNNVNVGCYQDAYTNTNKTNSNILFIYKFLF